MRIFVDSRHVPLRPEASGYLNERIHRVLERFQHRIAAVRVVVSGAGQRQSLCRIRVIGDRMPPVVAEARGASVLDAIGTAVRRAGRVLARAVSRRPGGRGFRKAEGGTLA